MLYLAIPAHNEADTIGVLLWRLRTVLAEFPREYEVVVYDDASSDVTPEVLEPYTKVLPLTVLRGERTIGYAGAVDALVRYVSRQTRYPRRDAMLLLQADFTDPPAFVPEFAKRFEGGADMVIGERTRPVDTPVSVRRLMRVAPWLMKPFVSVEGVRDITSSFRLVRISVLRDLIRAAGDAQVCVGDELTANADFLLRTVPLARRVETVPIEPTFGVRTRDTRRITMRDGLALARWAWRARGRRVAPSTAPESSSDNTRSQRNESRSDAKPDTHNEPRQDARRDTKHETRVDAKTESRTETRSDARVSSRIEARREARRDARNQSRPEPRSKPPRNQPADDLARGYGNDTVYDESLETRAEARPESAADSRSGARAEPRSEPRAEPRALPRDNANAEQSDDGEVRRSKRSRSKRRKRGQRGEATSSNEAQGDDNEEANSSTAAASVNNNDVSASAEPGTDEISASGSSDVTSDGTELDRPKRSSRKKRRKRGSRRTRTGDETPSESGAPDTDAATDGDAAEVRNHAPNHTRSRDQQRENAESDGDRDSGDDSAADSNGETSPQPLDENGAPRARRRGRRGRRGGARRSRNATDSSTPSDGEPSNNGAPHSEHHGGNDSAPTSDNS